MAGSVSGSRRGQQWLAPSTTTSSPLLRRAASLAVWSGTAKSRVPWMATTGTCSCARRCSIHRLPRLRRIETAGPNSRHGRVTWPTSVGRNSATELRGLLGVLEHRRRRHGVEGEQDDDAGHGRREHPPDVDQAVPGVAHDGVDEDDPEGPLGLVGTQLGDDAAAHRMAGEERPRDAQLVEDATQEVGVVAEVAHRRRGDPACCRGWRCRWRRP